MFDLRKDDSFHHCLVDDLQKLLEYYISCIEKNINERKFTLPIPESDGKNLIDALITFNEEMLERCNKK